MRFLGNLSILLYYPLPGENKYRNSISSRRFGRDESRARKCKTFPNAKGVGGVRSVPLKGQLFKLSFKRSLILGF